MRPEPSSPPEPSAPAPDARLDRTSWAILGALVAVYAAIIAGLAISGRFTFVWKTSVIPVLFAVALARRRLGPFLRDWAVFLALVILFDSMRGLVYATVTAWNRPVFATYAIDLDRRLLGGTTWPELLQRLLGAGPPGALAKALVVVHGSHFVAFLLFGITVWLTRRESFTRFTGATLLLIGTGLLLYAAVPTVPPWMADGQFHLISPIRHYTAEIYNTASPDLGRTFDVNPVAAMPSLHSALPVLFSIVAIHHYGRRGLPMLLYALAVVLAIGYLGEHYLIDIAAGVALALLVYFIVYRSRFWRPRPEPASDRRVLIRRGLAALSIVIGSELAGQAVIALRRPFLVDDAFIAAELEGRSDLASMYSAQLALGRSDAPAAMEKLGRAIEELRDDPARQVAMRQLLSLGFATGSPPPIPAALSGLPPERQGAAGATLLAWSRIAAGEREAGLQELDRVSALNPQDPDPLYLASWIRAGGSASERAAAAAAVDRLSGLAGQGVPGAAQRAEALRTALARSAP